MFRLALLALILTTQDWPPELCQLSGTVTGSSGEPLDRVEITAEPTAGGSAARTSTDSKGNFTIVDLKHGEYRLKGVRSGYLSTYYGARNSRGKGSAIILTPGQRIGDLGIRLIPYAVIAGAVRESDGEPVVDAEVEVFYLHHQAEGAQLQFAGRATTDDLGQYRIHDLAPGKYIATAKPANPRPDGDELPEDHSPKDAARERLAGQAYGGSATLAGARSVIVDEGALVAESISPSRGIAFFTSKEKSPYRRARMLTSFSDPAGRRSRRSKNSRAAFEKTASSISPLSLRDRTSFGLRPRRRRGRLRRAGLSSISTTRSRVPSCRSRSHAMSMDCASRWSLMPRSRDTLP